MPQVLSLILRRVLTIIPILLATTLFVFILLEFAPGDPAATSQGQAVSQEHRERFYEQHGLNDPLPLRYIRFLGNVLSGEFGYALVSGAPIAKLIANSVPVTIQLTALGLGFAAAIAFFGGILGAVYRDRWPDVVVRICSIAMVAAPNFWLGLLMINWFAIELSWLPAGGYEPLAKGFGPWFSSLIVPAVALGLPVRYLSDRLAVMYLGRVVEQGTTSAVADDPRHPYTQALLSASLSVGDAERERIILTGNVPSPRDHRPAAPFTRVAGWPRSVATRLSRSQSGRRCGSSSVTILFPRGNCCPARGLAADRRGNVLIRFDSKGSSDDAEQHPGVPACCLRHAYETGRAQEGHLAAPSPMRLEANTQSLKSPSPGNGRITIGRPRNCSRSCGP